MVGRTRNIYVIRGRDKKYRPTYIFFDTPGWALRHISFLTESLSVAVSSDAKRPWSSANQGLPIDAEIMNEWNLM
jgi:hypothetical protein